jgi:hypothetical protein
MIHIDTARGADALALTVGLANDAGALPQLLPSALPMLATGMAITLRELQVHLIDQELSG